MHRCKVLILTLAAFVSVGLLTGCDQDADDEAAEEQASAEEATDQDSGESESTETQELPIEATGPVAIVDGEEIGADRFNEAVSRRAGSMGGNMPPRLVQTMKQRTVQRLIDEHLIDKELAKVDIEVGADEVDQELAEFKERFPNEEAFQTFMTKNGIDADKMKENIKKDLTLRQLLEDKYGVEVTDEDAKKYYADNPKRFEQDNQVRARHILIKAEPGADEAALKEAKAKADKLVAEAKKPDADFAKLAEENSEGPSASRGGDLGFFSKERMVPEFSEVAFGMKPGEISDAVKTQFGYHVIKVEEKKEAGTVSYDDAKEDIISQLERQRFRESMKKFLKEIKDGVEIERKDDNIQVNVEAPKPGQQPQGMGGGMGGMPPEVQKQLQEQMQKQMQQRAKEQKGGGGEKSKPTELKLQEPSLGK